jgi:molybdopterin-containing oxidoreductase family iron-sulfur binding subunit
MSERWWELFETLAASDEFQAALRRDFPSQEWRFGAETDRREFLRLMGGSLALAGLAGCTRQPDERILPYAKHPEASVPGLPRYFATAFSAGGPALGLLVESHEGRPTKIEGNPDHPASLGASDAIAQAQILSLYDPDRSRVVLREGGIDTWARFFGELDERRRLHEARRGEGLVVLTQSVVSPTLEDQLSRLIDTLPGARWVSWQPLHRETERAGAELALGRDAMVRPRFENARIVLALDSDFLAHGPAPVRHARDLARRRDRARLEAEGAAPARLYSVESSCSITGAYADQRAALRPSEVELFARALASELGIAVRAGEVPERARALFASLLADLRANESRSLVLVGAWQDARVHALGHVLNRALGGVGRTLDYGEPVEARGGGSTAELADLVARMNAGEVESLLILSGNPAHDAPADLVFANALERVPFRVHLSQYEDETSRLCHWHLPEAHFLESWSDARAFDGSVSVVQPLIAPLYGGRTAHEIVAALAGRGNASPYELVRDHQRVVLGNPGDASFERAWERAVHDGVWPASARPPIETTLTTSIDLGPPPEPGAIELVLRPDASVLDGRFANNGWLQETPRPLTRLVWDNAALVSPAFARERALENGMLVELSLETGRSVRAPIWVLPGHPDGVVSVHLGYGRARAGRLGNGVGFDAYPLRTRDRPWSNGGLSIRATGERHELVSVQMHWSMEGRDIVRRATFADPAPARPVREEPHAESASLYPPVAYEGHAWGMVIDQSACTGCNACMVACQAENNVPVVGKAEAAKGRVMHWLRVDVYREGPESDPVILHQPVPCMHCEKAPCELVCPVGATVHSEEGLNEMVYNRCVGTRYCGNNCPYKVRRFNFLHYSEDRSEALALGRNPEVTVRSRGVMEKCTYCVQRIQRARGVAEKEGRAIEDGEIRTACQQACPSRAIVFGDLNRAGGILSQKRSEPHHYALLEELGTRPRTTYLARLGDPAAKGEAR